MDEIIETPKFSGKLESILPNGRIIYDGIEGDPEDFPLTDAELAEATATQATMPPTILTEVSMRQARLALNQAGLLTTVDAAVAALNDPAVTIEWEYAATVDRHSPMVALLAGELGLSEGQLDTLFAAAQGL